MWTFDFPWPSSDATGTGALQHDSRAPTPIVQLCPKINRTIARTIMQCIEAIPDRRPESAEAVLNMLRKVPSDNARE